MMALPVSDLLAAVADAGIRGTLVLAVAFAAAAGMRRSSASARHLVWLAALTAMLLLPLARTVVPEWRVLPVPAASAVLPTVPNPRPAPSAEWNGTAGRVAVSNALTGQSTQAPESTVPDPPASAPVDWARVALWAWAAGAALLALRLLYGVWRVWWMERRAVELTDEAWVRLTDGLSRRLRLGRIVRLLREPRATVPMTWGVFRPVVLLPQEAEGWDDERRRVVLAHELAHVRRWDAATQWVAHLALLVYWFNPLVWIAVRRLREEREHACDDAVLEIGTRAADYAGHLLEIVRSLGSAPGPAAALAMARRSQFEGRLLAILDTALPRRAVSRAAGLATTAAVLACLVPLAALRPAEAERAAYAEARTQAAADAHEAMTMHVEAHEGVVTASTDAQAAVSLAVQADGGSEALTVQAQRALQTPDGDPRLYAEIIRAAEGIGSSTERRQVLTGLLGKRDLSRDNLLAIFRALRGMDSESERRLVLAAAVDNPAFRALRTVPDELLDALRAFRSTSEQRLVLTAVFQSRRWDPAFQASLLRFVSEVDSDVEQRLILIAAAESQAVDGAARPAYLEALRALGSDVETRIVIGSLWDSRRWEPSFVAAVLRVAATMDSDVEKRLVLLHTAARQGVTGEVREAYLAAARAISSDSDRRMVLDALVAPEPAPASTPAPGNASSGEQRWDGRVTDEVRDDGVLASTVIRARGVYFRGRRSAFHRIAADGGLWIEESAGDHDRELIVAPGESGRPVFTYVVDGHARSFDAAARAWMVAVIDRATRS